MGRTRKSTRCRYTGLDHNWIATQTDLLRLRPEPATGPAASAAQLRKKEDNMPVYQLVHSGIPLSLSERDRLAKGILEIHHSETNAPEPFVRVVFTPLPLGTIYTAGKISPSVLLSCGIRAGRTHEVRQRIIRRCYDLLAEVTQAPADQIFVVVEEAESSWIMEAGFFLPEPDDASEAAWIAELQQAYPGQYDEWGPDGKRPIDHGGVLGSVAERAVEFRRLAEQLLSQTEREGVDALKVLEPLQDFVGDRVAAAKRAAAGVGRNSSSAE